MLTLRQRIFIVISVIVALILVILLWYLFVPSETKEQVGQIFKSDKEVTEEAGSAGLTTGGEPLQIPEVLTPPKFSQEVYVKQVARLFVERFASYSNQNDNQHIDDALALATKKMAKWLKTQKVETSLEYQGVSTKVIASSVEEISDNEAVVVVSTQQQVKKGNTVEVKQRSGRVELIKIVEDWKVNGFFWD